MIPEGKISPKASFADLIAVRKACHQKCKDGNDERKEAVRGSYKVAKDALKQAKSELRTQMKSTCGGKKGAKGDKMNKPPRKMFAKPF